LIDKRVAMVLDRLRGFERPKLRLEQYETPGELVRVLLSIADAEVGLEGARVLDLGAGTGKIGIGAVLAGASRATLVDVDGDALRVARENAERVGVLGRVELVRCDVREFRGGRFDVTIMNPPFGVQRRGADRPFVRVGLEHAPVVVSLHRAGTEDFWRERAREWGAECEVVGRARFPVPAMYRHHRRRIKHVGAVVLVFRRGR
jgi:putative methylase